LLVKQQSKRKNDAASQGRPRRDRHSTAEPRLAFRPDGPRLGTRYASPPGSTTSAGWIGKRRPHSMPGPASRRSFSVYPRRCTLHSGAKVCAVLAYLGAIPRSWSRFTPIRSTRNISTAIRRVWRMRRRLRFSRRTASLSGADCGVLAGRSEARRAGIAGNHRA
jgi:hypothetical protein